MHERLACERRACAAVAEPLIARPAPPLTRAQRLDHRRVRAARARCAPCCPPGGRARGSRTALDALGLDVSGPPRARRRRVDRRLHRLPAAARRAPRRRARRRLRRARWKLRQDERVTVIERANARHLTPASSRSRPTSSSLDVSFISLTKVLPAVLARRGARYDVWRWSSRSSRSAGSRSARAASCATRAAPRGARGGPRRPRLAQRCSACLFGLPGSEGQPRDVRLAGRGGPLRRRAVAGGRGGERRRRRHPRPPGTTPPTALRELLEAAAQAA